MTIHAVKIVKRYTMPTNGRQFAAVEMSNGCRVDVVTRYQRDSLPLYAGAGEIKAQAERQWRETEHHRRLGVDQAGGDPAISRAITNAALLGSPPITRGSS